MKNLLILMDRTNTALPKRFIILPRDEFDEGLKYLREMTETGPFELVRRENILSYMPRFDD